MSDTTTNIDPAELLALAAAATPGRWSWEDHPPTIYAGRDEHHHGLNILGRLSDIDCEGRSFQARRDLDYIVAACNAVPALVARLQAAESAIRGLRGLQRAAINLLVHVGSGGDCEYCGVEDVEGPADHEIDCVLMRLQDALNVSEVSSTATDTELQAAEARAAKAERDRDALLAGFDYATSYESALGSWMVALVDNGNKCPVVVGRFDTEYESEPAAARWQALIDDARRRAGAQH